MNYFNLKRVFDYLFLIFSFPITLTIILFFSILIKILNPKDTIFFIQDRVGLNGEIFKIIKFRTMDSCSDNSLFTSEDDPRINHFGSYLRKFRIDEVPQFINIFLGNMSLIGPRPEQVHFAKELSEKYGEIFDNRHKVLPGITGLAQVEYGYVGDYDNYAKKLEFDSEYIQNFSFAQDLKIFIKTFYIIFFGVGSR